MQAARPINHISMRRIGRGGPKIELKAGCSVQDSLLTPDGNPSTHEATRAAGGVCRDDRVHHSPARL
jgi:hypothetical protein